MSLVPSLTEAVALTIPSILVGATDYCTHPDWLDVARVGGSKYPDVAKVLALKPDLVLMNEEENRESDAAALREAGIAVHVTFPRTVGEALDQLSNLLTFLGTSQPPWLDSAYSAWESLPVMPIRKAVIPVWRRPWIVLGSATFAGDVLQRLGIQNVYAPDSERYPRPALADILAAGAELVILPDEPYLFTPTDGPEAFPGMDCAFVSGRHLTWHGPSLAEAPEVLIAALTPSI